MKSPDHKTRAGRIASVILALSAPALSVVALPELALSAPARIHSTTGTGIISGIEDLSLGLTGDLLLPGDTVDILLTAGSVAELQYIGFELEWDTTRFTFDHEIAGPLFDGGAVTFAGDLPNGRMGVAVSSSDGPVFSDSTNGNGENGSNMNPDTLLLLRFRVHDLPPTGSFTFRAFELDATDHDNNPVPVDGFTATAAGHIPPYITDTGMTGPGHTTIARGSRENFHFRLEAVDADESGFLQPPPDPPDPLNPVLNAEIGIVALDDLPDGGGGGGGGAGNGLHAIHPETFPDHAWSPMEYAGTENGRYLFEAPFPFDATVGTWLVAGRFRLGDQPVHYAGYGPGEGGLWDGDTYVTAVVTVTHQRVTLAHWSFDSESWSPDTGTFFNLGGVAGGNGESGDSGNGNGGFGSGFGSGDSGDGNGGFGSGFGSDGSGDDNSGSGDSGGNGSAGVPAHFGLTGASFNGWTGGSSGRAANSNNWHPATDGDGSPVEKYWHATLQADGYAILQVHWKMGGSNTGPRDFRIEYRKTGGGSGDGGSTDSWHPVPDSDIQILPSSSFTGYQVTLPVGADDTAHLQIRWLRTGEASVNDATISTSGTNRIDEVIVTGVPVDDTEMDVWPGDAGLSGTVDESDVMQIGYYWMSRGPERIPRNVSWAAQPVIRWIPQAAGHADTNGDGIVDHRDIMAIGRNFGETTGESTGKLASGHAAARRTTPTGLSTSVTGTPNPPPAHSQSVSARQTQSTPARQGPDGAPLQTITLPRLSAGDTMTIRVSGKEIRPFLGLSARIGLTGIPGIAWSVDTASPGNWAASWKPDGRLIDFLHVSAPDNAGFTSWSMAWSHKGVTTPAAAGSDLFSFTIRAETDWHTAPRLQLQQLSVMDALGAFTTPEPESLRIREGENEIPPPETPHQTRLHSNYPNPFNPVTTIPYDIAERSRVRISVYNLLGRRLVILVDQIKEPGSYQAVFDGTRFSSGVYMYRLEAGPVPESDPAPESGPIRQSGSVQESGKVQKPGPASSVHKNSIRLIRKMTLIR